jgi:hypothetical protein
LSILRVTTLIPPFFFTDDLFLIFTSEAMFTGQKYKLGGDTAITAASPSNDVGSQHLPTKSSSEKPEGRKRAVKVGGSIAEKDVVAVPFGTLAGDFGIRPLPAKERNRQGLANEVSEAPLLKASAGEVPAASNVTSKEAKGKRYG